MDNASTETPLAAHSQLVKEGADYLTVIIFTNESMDEDEPVTVANIPPVRFIGGTKNKVITGNIQVEWDPEI